MDDPIYDGVADNEYACYFMRTLDGKAVPYSIVSDLDLGLDRELLTFGYVSAKCQSLLSSGKRAKFVALPTEVDSGFFDSATLGQRIRSMVALLKFIQKIIDNTAVALLILLCIARTSLFDTEALDTTDLAGRTIVLTTIVLVELVTNNLSYACNDIVRVDPAAVGLHTTFTGPLLA